MPVRSYLVCATQRSGSTLLCELLKDTGVAGRPEEYFEASSDTGLPPHPGDYLEDLPRTGAGIRDDMTPPRAPEHSSLLGVESYREHLDRTFRRGTTSNGVFGAKLMWRNLPDLQRLAGELPKYAGLDLGELLERMFDDPSYVWVTRRDKVRQAVSLWRALQTRSWRHEHAGDPMQPEELHYRFEGIDHLVRSLQEADEGWRDFFAGNGKSALQVVYEDDLEHGAAGAVRAVLTHVGVPLPGDWHPREVLGRQADGLSDDWVAAYHRDAAVRGERIVSASLSVR